MYVDSPRVCKFIIEEEWEPPTNVIARWVEMCMEEVWKTTNRLRAICLDPLHLANRESVLEDLQAYIGKIQANVDHLLEGAETWHRVEAVDMVVVPVKVARTWALYLTQKSTRQQSVIRFARGVRKVEGRNCDDPGAAFNLDRLIHSMGVSVMAIWLNSVTLNMKGQGAANFVCKQRADEAKEAVYNVVGGTTLRADVLTPGVACMYLIQGALIWDQNQPG
jgi:hypothetical protein